MLTIHCDEELNPILFNQAMYELKVWGVPNLLTGTRYKVTLDDCCAKGWFIDTLKYAQFKINRNGEPRLEYLRFENAEIMGWYEIEKVEE
jgi:hypothetical protein